MSVAGWGIPRSFTGQLGHMTAGALAPDASWGATVGDDGWLRFWRASDGTETGRLLLTSTAAALAASSMGGLVAVGDSAGRVTGVDPATASPRWTVTSSAGAVLSLHFAPDGQTLIVGTAAGFEWRSASAGSLVRAFPPPADGGVSAGAGSGAVFIAASALSPDGTRLAFATGDPSGLSAVQVVAASDGTALGPAITAQNHTSALAFSADGTQVVIGTYDGAVLYDVATGATLRAFETFEFPRDMALSADGTILAVAADYLHFYRFSDGTEVNTSGQTGFIWNGMFARDGRRLEFPGVAGPTQVWDAAQGAPLRLIDRSTANGNQGSVIFSPTDQLLVAFNETGTYWDIGHGTVISTVTFATDFTYDTVNDALFTPDGLTLIGSASDQHPGQVRFWDATTGALTRMLPAHAAGLTALALSRDGTLLATAGYEQPAPDGGIVPVMNEIKLWDVASSTLRATLQGHTDLIDSIAFSPDGTLLLSGDRYGLVRLWSVPDGQPVRDLATGPVPVIGAEFNNFGASVAFSPDGTKVAAAGVDWTITSGHTGVIAIWSTADGSLVGKLLSLADANLGAITWSPSGNLLSAGSAGGMRVWCLDELQTPEH
jgi:WD40 repeat protein